MLDGEALGCTERLLKRQAGCALARMRIDVSGNGCGVGVYLRRWTDRGCGGVACVDLLGNS